MFKINKIIIIKKCKIKHYKKQIIKIKHIEKLKNILEYKKIINLCEGKIYDIQN